MTDEDFVRGWLERQWGKEFSEEHHILAVVIQRQLAGGVLDTVVYGRESLTICGCNIRSLTPVAVRFYLSEFALMDICVKCDSWSISDTVKKIRKDKGLE